MKKIIAAGLVLAVVLTGCVGSVAPNEPATEAEATAEEPSTELELTTDESNLETETATQATTTDTTRNTTNAAPLSTLSARMENTIKRDWFFRPGTGRPRPNERDFNPEDIHLVYLDTFNENIALIIRDPYSGHHTGIIEQGIQIAGYNFYFPNIVLIHIWSNGVFFSLPQAYQQGLLTSDDIGSIHRAQQT